MSNLLIKTKYGNVSLTKERLQRLVAEKKVPLLANIISIDGGSTWTNAEYVLSVPAILNVAIADSTAVHSEMTLDNIASESIPKLILASYILSGTSLLLSCITAVPAVICASIAYNNLKTRAKAKPALQISILALVITTIGFAILGKLTSKETTNSVNPAQDLVTSKTSSKSDENSGRNNPTVSQPPDDERRFIEIVTDARTSFNKSGNDLLKANARDQRQESLANAFPGLEINNWVGKIVEIGANGGGKGTLSIQIAPSIRLLTSNNVVSDLGMHTLIEKESELYKSLLTKKQGQTIRFSGYFIEDPNDHFLESSLTLRGSMVDPEYFFRFTSIDPLN